MEFRQSLALGQEKGRHRVGMVRPTGERERGTTEGERLLTPAQASLLPSRVVRNTEGTWI